MSTSRPELLRAVARSEEIIRDLPAHFIERDADRVPALAFLKPDEHASSAGARAALWYALLLIEQIDGLIEVAPSLFVSVLVNDAHEVRLTERGRRVVCELHRQSHATPSAAAQDGAS